MQDFKTFISKEDEGDDDLNQPLEIEVDERTLENNKDSLNADLDRLTSAPYQNPMVFYNQIRGTMERYQMIIPPHATKHFLNFDAEMAFKLGDSPLYLYVVFNTKHDGLVDGYAQVVDIDELDNLMSNDEVPNLNDDQEDDDEEEMSYNEKYRKRMDDDG
jgi:hypothetical protein